ncbi:MAG: hypothetical protein Q9169_002380 [Polycauliona sp. 2 TL-2023]
MRVGALYGDLTILGRKLLFLNGLDTLLRTSRPLNPLASERPFVCPINSEGRMPYSEIALAFCFAINLLHPGRFNTGPTFQSMKNGWLEQHRRPFLNCLTPVTTEENGPLRLQGRQQTLKALATAYLAFAYLIRDLRRSLAIAWSLGSWNIQVHPNSQTPTPHAAAIPGVDSIPFTDFMDLPIPFNDGGLSAFAACHLSHMTNPNFLQDGSEWSGYYSVPQWQRPFDDARAEFDPVMHGIRFSVTKDEDRVLDVQGTGGCDEVGAFELRGTIDAETGALHMEKVYTDQGFQWRWVGFLTPFGIIASWGEASMGEGEPEGYGGWVWLYKTAWCRKLPEGFVPEDMM